MYLPYFPQSVLALKPYQLKYGLKCFHNFVSVTLISVCVTCILEVAEIWETETEIRVTETLLPKYLGNVTHIFGVTHILGYSDITTLERWEYKICGVDHYPNSLSNQYFIYAFTA